MARDYEDLYDIEELSDEELTDLVTEQFESDPELDAEHVSVTAEAGLVRVAGRVGTEAEIQRIEEILDEELGLPDYDSEVVLDELARGELPEDADAAAEELSESGDVSSDGDDRTDDAAEHLMDDPDGDLYGTQDVSRAVERGETYSPPERPPQMGTRSRERH